MQILIKGLAALGAVNLHMGFAGEVSLEEALDSAFRTADIMAFLEWIIHMRQCANIDFTQAVIGRRVGSPIWSAPEQ